MEKIRVFEGFAGYGGASFALKKTKIPHEIVGYSEIKKNAIEIYNLNFPNIKNYGDITKIDADDLPDFDLFTGGFHCQTFSTIGKNEGENDERGILYRDIIRICEAKKPKYILLENVKGLISKKHIGTFKTIISELERIGYEKPQFVLLNSKDYGNAQNRVRLWIFARFGGLPNSFVLEPPKKQNNCHVKSFLDINPDKKLYKTEKQIENLHKRYSPSFEVDETVCFDAYNKKIKKDGVCPTIRTLDRNDLFIIEPIKDNKERVRKLSINEIFRLMGFEINDKINEISFPQNLSYASFRELAGNGWDVNLSSILLKHIFSQLNEK